MSDPKNEAIRVPLENVTYGTLPAHQAYLDRLEEEKKEQEKEEEKAAKSSEYVWANAREEGWKKGQR